MQIIKDLRSARALTLGSGCKLAFIKKKNSGIITPVLMLMGSEAAGQNNGRVWSEDAEGTIGVINVVQHVDEHDQPYYNTEFETTPPEIAPVTIAPIITDASNNDGYSSDWITLNPNEDQIVYPRIFIRSLGLKTDSTQLTLKYQQTKIGDKTEYSPLKPYEDYSILTRSVDNEYVLTLNSENFLRQSASSDTGLFEEKRLLINYTISNADTSIYLDALEVAKENSEPQVSYEVTPEAFQSQALNDIYNKMGYLVRINDSDLKFENVRGYISSFTLKLDAPDEDTIEIKNYKTKFEDLFSTITAQTEAMKKNSRVIENAASVFTSTGEISEEVMQSTIRKVDLDYAFDNGKLTIDEHNGIWGTSDSGVVAFRGGGIFTATEKNAQGNWRWNTGITPEGINADLITSGQLDTNLIKIYAGDHLRFQMNGDGIFAYKSTIDDAYVNDGGELVHPLGTNTQGAAQSVKSVESLDGKQYVRFNDDGLALIAKKGAKVLNTEKNGYINVLDDDEIFTSDDPAVRKLIGVQQIKRVEVSWEGFVMRNWKNEKVFYAQPETGNLMLMGTIHASGGTLGLWNFNGAKLWADATVQNNQYTTFVALNAGSEEQLFKGDGTSYNIDLGSDKDGKKLNTNPYAFWAGTPNPYQAPFSIQKNGVLTAVSGTIGGWKITQDALSSKYLTLASGTSPASVTNSKLERRQVRDEQTGKLVWRWIEVVDDTSTVVSYYMWGKTTEAGKAQDANFSINTHGEIFAKDYKYKTSNGYLRSVLSELTTLSNRIGAIESDYLNSQDQANLKKWVTDQLDSLRSELQGYVDNKVASSKK